ncbi:SGNH/GDSL hydrolase family protein [Aeromicrobium sp. 179-A 4D2 NHS]|uniref:SGNH/GDSL hydrolase family protein n=1 Tax=Aeromicrobium sp. 179-A 4D2 NHS TaxID=3142375 RepID=UPI0039A141FB
MNTLTRFARAVLSMTAVAALGASLTAASPAIAATTSATTVSDGAAPAAKPTIMVVGDSITARYNNIPGHANQGWWSMVGQRLNATMLTSAEAGTGIIARGGVEHCKLMDKNPLTNHGVRTRNALRKKKFDALIVEVGANDWRRCTTVNKKVKVVTKVRQKTKVKVEVKGKTVTKTVTKTVNKVSYKTVKVGTTAKNSNELIRAKVRDYIALLKTEAKAAGLPTTQIAFMYPRGPAIRADRDRVAFIYADEVKKAGLYWVNVGILPQKMTVDGTHPNLAGNNEISGWFMLNLNREAPKFEAQVINRPNWKAR